MAEIKHPSEEEKKKNTYVSFEAYVEAVSAYRKLLSPELYTYGAAVSGPTNSGALDKAKKEMDQAGTSFVKANGDITNMYICGGSKTATLTCEMPAKGLFSYKNTKFYTQYELGKNPAMERVLVEIDYLAAESSRLLRGDNLNRCLKLIYKTARNTMVLLDGVTYHSQDKVYDEAKIAETMKVIEHNLTQAKAFHKRVAKFTAQTDYMVGNLIGLVVLCCILFIVFSLSGLDLTTLFRAVNQDDSLKLSSLLFYGVTAGGIGAIISVMNRVSTSDLNINYDPDSRTIRIIGMFRPVIGAVFGAVLLILFNSGLSIFSLTEAGPGKIASNLILLAFIAGFFERMVPDILDQTKGKLTTGESSLATVDATAVE